MDNEKLKFCIDVLNHKLRNISIKNYKNDIGNVPKNVNELNKTLVVIINEINEWQFDKLFDNKNLVNYLIYFKYYNDYFHFIDDVNSFYNNFFLNMTHISSNIINIMINKIKIYDHHNHFKIQKYYKSIALNIYSNVDVFKLINYTHNQYSEKENINIIKNNVYLNLKLIKFFNKNNFFDKYLYYIFFNKHIDMTIINYLYYKCSNFIEMFSKLYKSKSAFFSDNDHINITFYNINGSDLLFFLENINFNYKISSFINNYNFISKICYENVENIVDVIIICNKYNTSENINDTLINIFKYNLDSYVFEENNLLIFSILLKNIFKENNFDKFVTDILFNIKYIDVNILFIIKNILGVDLTKINLNNIFSNDNLSKNIIEYCNVQTSWNYSYSEKLNSTNNNDSDEIINHFKLIISKYNNNKTENNFNDIVNFNSKKISKNLYFNLINKLNIEMVINDDFLDKCFIIFNERNLLKKKLFDFLDSKLK